MRYLYASLSILLTGCSWPSVVVPVIGKPQFGNTYHNTYQGAVTQTKTPWEMYFWLTILILSLILTPLGGMLFSKLKQYAAAFKQTARAIEEGGDDKLKEELSKRQTDTTKDLVRALKAKGAI